ncbi:hypothetical protein MKW92_036499 [Papaver armeniacum]|nr:hypothetical protein MKW92_036499 [Papaver armeniacum]
MKLKVVCWKAYNYVRYDLKQIAFPSSFKLGRDIGPDLRPNDYKKEDEYTDKHDGVNTIAKDKEPSTLEDLGGGCCQRGMETLRPALQRVYMTRASSYRDALKSFIQGYQEGIQQVMSGKDDPKIQQPEDPHKKSD